MNTVLFACIHNAGRSQMAAAWFNALADKTKASAVSAGTEPGTRVHPEVLLRCARSALSLKELLRRNLRTNLRPSPPFSSRWVAAKLVRTCPACAGWIGRSKIRRANRWSACAKFVMTAKLGCSHC